MTDVKKQQDSKKTCAHPSFSKERIMGAQTGDYICDECGAEFSYAEVKRIEATRSKVEEK